MTYAGLHSDLTEKIIKAFYQVYNELGYGFSEKIYEKALTFALNRLGLAVEVQKPIEVYYDNHLIGDYLADVVVNNAVIVELKAARKIIEDHEAQLLNYLKATRFEVGLLLNFGPTPDIKRKIYDNSKKGTLSWIKTNDTNLNTESMNK